MHDFWERHDIGYRLFGQFCNPTDWFNIIKTIAYHFGWADRKELSRNILDVGAGTGHNTEAILEHMTAANGCRCTATAVEPSRLANVRINEHLVSETAGGYLRQTYASYGGVGAAKYDGALFLHSTYYIPSCDQVVTDCIGRLRPGGVLQVLSLSRSSPFFKVRGSLQPFLAEDIAELSERSGWEYQVIPLPSHFHLRRSIMLNDSAVRHLERFICDGSTGDASGFKERLYAHLGSDDNDGVDLEDKLIRVIRR